MVGQLTIHNPRAGHGAGGPGHDYNLRTRKGGFEENLMIPLITKSGGNKVYQPFSFTDMGCILDKMPNPVEGGGPWMNKLCQLTTGQELAMGDWRALIGNQVGSWETQQLETMANTLTHPDDEPFNPNSTAIGRAMRHRFPVPQGAIHNLSFSPKAGEEIPEYLLRCKDTWTNVAGKHPGSDDLQQVLFRKAVMAGMPKVVQQAMEANPDIPGCDTAKWEKHLAHHHRHHRIKQEEAEETEAESGKQLLKLQLDEAKRKATDARKLKDQKGAQMVQQVPAPQPPQCPQQPPVMPGPPQPYYYWPQGGPPRHHGMARPRGNRGGFRGRGRGRGAYRQPTPPPANGCFLCGQPDHWRRDCPYYLSPQGYGPAMTGGYRVPPPPPTGPPASHQAPNVSVTPPHGQYPVTGNHEQGRGLDYGY